MHHEKFFGLFLATVFLVVAAVGVVSVLVALEPTPAPPATAQITRTPLPPPNPPSNLTAQAASPTLVILHWRDNSPNELGFKIERATSTGAFAEIATVGKNVTVYYDYTVTASTTYSYRVRAYNRSGNSAYSNVATVTTPDNPPNPPSNLTANATSPTSIDLRWRDNSNNETNFEIQRKRQGESGFSHLATTSADRITYTDNAVSPRTTYTYRVRAYNSSGFSAFSNDATATTPGTPDPPSNLTATGTAAVIDLRWQDNSSYELGFKIERAATSTGSFRQIASVSANTIAYADADVVASTTYIYRIRSYNEYGNSGYSNTASSTTRWTGMAPNPPSSLAATGTAAVVDLAWQDNSADERGFKVERSATTTGAFTQIAVVGANARAYMDANVQASTTYVYRIRAFSKDNSGYSGMATTTTRWTGLAPNPPSDLAATSTPAYASLLWRDNAGDERGFKIERGTSSTTMAQIAVTPANEKVYRDTDVAQSTTYYYRIRAFSKDNSNYSSTTGVWVPPQ